MGDDDGGASSRRLRPVPEGRLRRCFCEVSEDLLLRLARRRYVDGLSTLELMKEASGTEEKEAASCVGLLELPEDFLIAALETGAHSTEHVREYRRKVRAALKAAGVDIP